MSTTLQYQRQWETKRRNGTDIAWNKGKTKEEYPQMSNSGVKKGNISWNKGKKTGLIPWNKGMVGVLVSWNKGNVGYRKGIRRLPVDYKCSEETKKKMSLSHTLEKAYNYKGGKPKCIECGKQLKGYKSKRCPYCFHKGLMERIRLNGPTSIERKLYDELKNRGLLFETQKLINGKFMLDAYIPSLNLVIEADGDYWHSLDKQVKRDKSRDAYLSKCGFNLLRISETNINNGSFVKILSEALN